MNLRGFVSSGRWTCKTESSEHIASQADSDGAQPTCLVLLKMALPSATAATMVAKLSSESTMSAACLATAVPDPMATPMSAFFRAGASLTPSPVMATTSPCGKKESTLVTQAGARALSALLTPEALIDQTAQCHGRQLFLRILRHGRSSIRADVSCVQGMDIVLANTSHEQATMSFAKLPAVLLCLSCATQHFCPQQSLRSELLAPSLNCSTPLTQLAACLGFEELHEAPFVAGLHPRKDCHLGHSVGLVHRGEGVKLQSCQDGQWRLMGVKTLQCANLEQLSSAVRE